ncbi:MAG: hypothetical protein HPY90_15925 [Syntrophothermus sp.]|uniref:PilX N-terminal domain-containing pilus assembly protein n=1 Tax=Syntrophothermus sp. TaxID=2736299 RepID=UPI0025807C57|nr:PilX N-terminal domain-containing pilus assembly protein [Syntrophothermus sp.]NSW84674.1 hypothetical protein [Syntrophothermus sp.]
MPGGAGRNLGGQKKSLERAQALVLVMVVLFVLLLLATAVVTLAGSHRRNAASQRDLVQAYYAADAGVERLLVKIREEPGWYAGLPFNLEQTVFAHVSYAGGEIQEVRVKKEEAVGPGTKLAITSVGAFHTARRTIVASVLVSGVSDLVRGISILPPVAQGLTISGNFSLVPDPEDKKVLLVLNGSLTLSGSTEIRGDAYASGSITEQHDNIKGNTYPNYPDVPPFPSLDVEHYKSRALESGQCYQGDKTFGGKNETTSYSGVYFVEGNVEISGKYRGRAVIVATGRIDVTGDLKADNTASDMLVFISFGDVDIKNHEVDAVVVAKGRFSAQGNASLYGGVLAQGLDFSGQGGGTVTITCNPDLVVRNIPSEVAQGTSMSLKVESWKEQYPVL